MPTPHPETVLIVEDDAGIAMLEQLQLERAGFQVLTAATAAEALQRLTQATVDLILLDYRLDEDADGLDLYAQMRAAGFQQPVILVTGFSNEATAIKALRAGVCDFVTKSAEYLDYLPEAVERALAQVRIEKQLAKVQEQQRQAGERIRELGDLLDRANDAILICDQDQRIRYWSKGAEQLYGWTAAEALGQDVCEFLTLESDPAEAHVCRKAMVKGTWFGELRQAHMSGKELIVASRWNLARDAQGLPKGFLVINSDITEKKNLENQLQRTQRMESIGVLAGGIAHDLNNALTPIMMGVQILQMNMTDPASRNVLDTLQASVERGAAMVKQILTFARGTDAQRQPLQLEPVVRELGKMIQRTFPKDIEVLTLTARDLHTIAGDSTQIYQVLMNLCVNARDAMPSGGELTVSAENVQIEESDFRLAAEARPGPYVLLKVIDNGTGIPSEALERIFDPFFTTKERGKGTGLGLSVTFGIVKSHGGFIKVDTKTGLGTEFRVYLPALGAAAADKSVEQCELPGGKGELVLVVDDEASVNTITKATLEAFGYRALTASDGVEAVTMYFQHAEEIQVVLTDMIMPNMDGLSTIRALRRLNPNLKIIASSGVAAGEQAAENAGLGEKAILLKPYTAEKLLTKLRGVLDAR